MAEEKVVLEVGAEGEKVEASESFQKEQVEDRDAPEEDTGAKVEPIVKLQEVSVASGEEDELVLLDMKAKLFRYDKDEWKERGLGAVKLLKLESKNRVRLVMRQNKTHKLCANHYLTSSMKLNPHSGSETAYLWNAMDYSDGEFKEELFCIRFGSVDQAVEFKDAFEEAVASLRQVPKVEEAAASEAAASFASQLSLED